jgi:HK97 family phage major capsid protein
MPDEELEVETNVEPEVEEVPEDKVIGVINTGSRVKALGNGKVGGYLVRFGSEKETDLGGDYFTIDTDFGDAETSDVYYQHGADKRLGTRLLSKGSLKEDEIGVWIEAQLAIRDEYEKFLYEQAEAGKMGWSSGTVGHLVEVEKKGKATWIKTWPLGLDASLTPAPMEPRNTVIPLKSYLEQLEQAETPEVEDVGDTSPEGGDAEPAVKTAQPLEEQEDNNMAEYTQEQLEELISKAGKAGAEEALKSLPTINDAGVAVVHDPADDPFKSMGEQLEAVKKATLTQGRVMDDRLTRLNIKQLGANELVGSEGGFLLEPSFVSEILKPLHDSGPFSSRAAKLSIGPNANGVTVRAVDETSRAEGSRWGGIKGYRLAEAATKQASSPTFRLMELRLKKYAIVCYATEELLQDTTALAGIISQGCSEELDFMVNDDILNGAGAGGPLGILSSGALITQDAEAGQLADTIVTENIVHMWARMHPRSKNNSVWYINPNVTPQLYLLEFVVGVGGYPAFMGPGSMPNAPSGLLFGRPVIETEFNPTLGDVGDILLADMSQYVMIDKDVQAASSIHVQFLTDQVAYRFVYRCDGQPKIAAPLTPYKGTDTIGPFVALEAR